MRTSITMPYPPPTRTGRAGLTLIELMVAMTILVILTLAVSQIVSQAQRVVTIGHTSMRNSAKIGALKTVIRDDLRRVTPTGFLFIDSSYDTADNPQGFLAFTTTGPADTMTPETSNAASVAIATYGLRNYKSSNPDAKVLNRVNVLMNARITSGPDDELDETTDRMPYELAHLQSNYYPDADKFDHTTPVLDTTDVSTLAAALRERFKFLPTDAPNPFAINLLQEHLTLDDITKHSWKVMTPHVAGLEIFWTDGTMDGNNKLHWYGGKDGVRKGTGASGDPLKDVESGSGATYTARWTNETDPNLWPRAIKIVITIKDNTMAAEDSTYEIICPVGP